MSQGGQGGGREAGEGCRRDSNWQLPRVTREGAAVTCWCRHPGATSSSAGGWSPLLALGDGTQRAVCI